MNRNATGGCGPEISPRPKGALQTHKADEDGGDNLSGADAANLRQDLVKSHPRQRKRKERAQEQDPLGQAQEIVPRHHGVNDPEQRRARCERDAENQTGKQRTNVGSPEAAGRRDEGQKRRHRSEIDHVLPRFNEAAIERRPEKLRPEECQQGHRRIRGGAQKEVVARSAAGHERQVTGDWQNQIGRKAASDNRREPERCGHPNRLPHIASRQQMHDPLQTPQDDKEDGIVRELRMTGVQHQRSRCTKPQRGCQRRTFEHKRGRAEQERQRRNPRQLW